MTQLIAIDGAFFWGASKQDRSYFVLPQVLRLDGVWRNIPREVFGDFPQPPAFADQTAPPITPEPNGHPLPGAQSAARHRNPRRE